MATRPWAWPRNSARRIPLQAPTLEDGPLTVDLHARAALVRSAGVPSVALDLTLTEFNLLATLMRAPTRAYSRRELFEACLPGSDALERVIDTHVNNLRRKLEEQGISGIPQAIHGPGYRLRKCV